MINRVAPVTKHLVIKAGGVIGPNLSIVVLIAEIILFAPRPPVNSSHP